MDAIAAAKTGITNAVQGLAGASGEFADALTRRGGDEAAAVAVNLIYARNGVRASAAVLKGVAKTDKSLLDIKV